jgi:SAM-dependent methyltransferase
MEYELIAELYDHVVPHRERQDVGFFVEEAVASGGPVLEVGCGTGRVLIPTARAGVEITGLDRSPRMLQVCEENLQAEPSEVRARTRLVEGDMRAFDLGNTYRLIMLPFRPFQHLITVADQLECLRTLQRHLDDTGTLILDLFNPSLHHLVRDNLGEEFGDEPEFTMPDGRRVVRKHKTVARDLWNQVNQNELIYEITHTDGRRERIVHAFAMRYLFRFEVEHLLERCGFRVQRVYADHDRSPFGSKYPGELIVVAEKR